MSILNVKNLKGGGRDLGKPKVGTHKARFMGVVGIGIQERPPYQGVEKPACEQAYFLFELLDDQVDLDGVMQNRRFSTKVNMLPGDKGKLHKYVSTMDPTDRFKGDLSKMVGLPVLLELKSEISPRTKEEFIFLNNMMSPFEGIEFPEATLDPMVFEIEGATVEEFNAIPNWLQKRIEASVGFDSTELGKALANTSAVGSSSGGESASSDDLPPWVE